LGFIVIAGLTACEAGNAREFQNLSNAERAQAQSFKNKTNLFGQYKLSTAKKKSGKIFPKDKSSLTGYNRFEPPESILEFIPSNSTTSNWNKKIVFHSLHLQGGKKFLYDSLDNDIKNFLKNAKNNPNIHISSHKKQKDKENSPTAFAKYSYTERNGNLTMHNIVAFYTDKNRVDTMYYKKKNTPITEEEERKIDFILLSSVKNINHKK
jgi:hypothetical protein